MDAVYIYTSGATKEEAVSEDFLSVINSVYIDPANETDISYTSSSSSSGNFESYAAY